MAAYCGGSPSTLHGAVPCRARDRPRRELVQLAVGTETADLDDRAGVHLPRQFPARCAPSTSMARPPSRPSKCAPVARGRGGTGRWCRPSRPAAAPSAASGVSDSTRSCAGERLATAAAATVSSSGSTEISASTWYQRPGSIGAGRTRGPLCRRSTRRDRSPRLRQRPDRCRCGRAPPRPSLRRGGLVAIRYVVTTTRRDAVIAPSYSAPRSSRQRLFPEIHLHRERGDDGTLLEPWATARGIAAQDADEIELGAPLYVARGVERDALTGATDHGSQ